MFLFIRTSYHKISSQGNLQTELTLPAYLVLSTSVVMFLLFYNYSSVCSTTRSVRFVMLVCLELTAFQDLENGQELHILHTEKVEQQLRSILKDRKLRIVNDQLQSSLFVCPAYRVSEPDDLTIVLDKCHLPK